MKLIDAEDFGRVIREYCKDCIEHNKQKMDIVDINADIQDFLDNQPTEFDVNKVIKQLEELKEWEDVDGKAYYTMSEKQVINKAIKIGERGGIDEEIKS